MGGLCERLSISGDREANPENGGGMQGSIAPETPARLQPGLYPFVLSLSTSKRLSEVFPDDSGSARGECGL